METKFPLLLSLLLTLAAFTTGCGSIRVVSEAKTGGTLVLDGTPSASRHKAEEYMRKQCPGGYEVVEEGDTAGDTDATREWRIAYRCIGSSTNQVAMVAY